MSSLPTPPTLRPITIGDVQIDCPVVLAPMTGVTDLPFRKLVRRFGSGLNVTEMIASEAAIRETRQSLQKAMWDAIEEPVSMQLVGCTPWEMGEAAAVWALTDGPYAALAKDKSYRALVDKLSLVWTMYFTAGRLETKAFDDHAEFKIVGNGLPHVCVEYAVMGFGRKAIEMVGKKTKTSKRLVGVKDGDGSVVHYEFWFV